MTKPTSMDAFFKSLRKSHASSNGGTKAAEKMNVVQTEKLRLFKPAERTGKTTGAKA